MSGSSSDAEQELQLVTALAAASSKHCMGDSQKITEEIHYHERVYSMLGLPGAMMMIDEHVTSCFLCNSICMSVRDEVMRRLRSVGQASPPPPPPPPPFLLNTNAATKRKADR